MTDTANHPTPPPTMADLTALLHHAAQVHHGLTADAAGLTAATALGHLYAGRDDQAWAALEKLDDAALRRAERAADMLAVFADFIVCARHAARTAPEPPADAAGLRGLAAREAAA